jgi:midasin
MAIKNPREVENSHRICSDVLPELEGSYEGILKETFMLAVGVLGKLTDFEICNNGAEESPVGTITSWKDVLQSYTVNLKLDHICDASEKLCITVVCSFTLYT